MEDNNPNPEVYIAGVDPYKIYEAPVNTLGEVYIFKRIIKDDECQQ